MVRARDLGKVAFQVSWGRRNRGSKVVADGILIVGPLTMLRLMETEVGG